MKKTFAFAAALMFAFATFAADRWTNVVSIAAGATSSTTTLELFRAGGDPCSEIESVFVTCASGSGTGTVVFATYDYGVATTIATSDAIKSGESYSTFPVSSASVMYTYPVVQNVVTGDVVMAVENVQTNYAVAVKSYLARQLRMTITQAAVADATVYKAVITAK